MITVIPLIDQPEKELRLINNAWEFFSHGQMIRNLNRFENNFVNSALLAAYKEDAE